MRIPILLNVEMGFLNSPTDELEEHGYIEAEKLDDTDDAEHFWHLCNWDHWSETQPENLFSDVCTCSHGIVFVNPETNTWYLALSNGWLAGDEKTIKDYIHKHHNDTFWGDEKAFFAQVDAITSGKAV